VPIQITKPEPNPATAQLAVDAGTAIVNALRSLAPAVQKAGEEMGRSFSKLRTQPPA
jgi:hypothetical protein